MSLGPLVLLGGVAALLLASSSSRAGGSGTSTPTGPTGDAVTNKQKLYAQLRSLPMLTEDQRLFLMLVAHGESNYNPKAFNDSEAEAAASARAFERLQEQGRIDPDCGYTRENLGTGSGGRFGRLVAYYVNDLREVVPCIKPESIGDGLHDIVSAVATARALQGYATWNGTIGGLRGGWGTPAWLDGAPADKIAKWARHADEGGFSGEIGRGGMEFLARPLTRFTGDLRGVLRSLQVRAVS